MNRSATNRRRGASPRTRSLAASRLTRAEIERGKLLEFPVAAPRRPATRADCENGPRPCAFVGCRYHLYADVNPATGSLKINFPDVAPDELEKLPDTCALDVADRGPHRLEEVGVLIRVVRERARQIEAIALDRLRARFVERAGGDAAARDAFFPSEPPLGADPLGDVGDNP